MANYTAAGLHNEAANDVTAETITVRLHTGSTGNSGNNNQIAGATANVPSSSWSSASGGRSQTAAALDFGVLSTSQENTVRAYSLWKGATFLGWADLVADVAVAANETFSLNAGTVAIVFS